MKKALFIMTIGVVFLTSCASAKQSLPFVEMPAAAPEMAVEERSYDEKMGNSDYATASGVVAQSVERLIIKNASLKIAVADPLAGVEAITKLAERMGGFIVSSNVYTTTLSSGAQLPQGYITIRIPAEKLDEAMDEVKALVADAKTGVINESVSGQDVTSDYVDSKSRLRNLEAAEESLVKLLDSATDLEYVLEIFRELTSVRSEIEVLKGHIKYLEESADLSALTVELVAEASLQPIEIGGWKPKGVARDAVQALINTLQWFGTAAIWLGIYCLPFLIPLSIAGYFLIKAIRKARAKRRLVKESAQEMVKEE